MTSDVAAQETPLQAAIRSRLPQVRHRRRPIRAPDPDGPIPAPQADARRYSCLLHCYCYCYCLLRPTLLPSRQPLPPDSDVSGAALGAPRWRRLAALMMTR